jgi:hypothetical protein
LIQFILPDHKFAPQRKEVSHGVEEKEITGAMPPKIMSASKVSNNKISKDKEGHMPDYEALARDSKNWASRHVKNNNEGGAALT